jgi:hypothetical protein
MISGLVHRLCSPTLFESQCLHAPISRLLWVLPPEYCGRITLDLPHMEEPYNKSNIFISTRIELFFRVSLLYNCKSFLLSQYRLTVFRSAHPLRTKWGFLLVLEYLIQFEVPLLKIQDYIVNLFGIPTRICLLLCEYLYEE